jgi:phospholipase D1/2
LIVKNFEDYGEYLPPKRMKPGHLYNNDMPAQEIKAKLDEIKGHLVWMPLDFLRDAPMAERGLSLNEYTESIYT